MPLCIESRTFTPSLCRETPLVLFPFGDNLAGWGNGGQAVIRGEPNAIGIPTKHRPARDADAYLSDDDFPTWLAAVTPPMQRLAAHLRAGGIVAWPAAGIGTGLAELPTRAPRIWAALERGRARLEAIVPDPGGGEAADFGAVADLPLVRATLKAFPGAQIVGVRKAA